MAIRWRTLCAVGLLATLAYGCGRLGFGGGDEADPIGLDGGPDGGPPGANLPCNVTYVHDATSTRLDPGFADDGVGFVWVDNRDGFGTDYHVHFATMNLDGHVLSTPVELGGSRAFRPRAAFSGSSYGITWRENAGSDQVFAAAVDESGALLGPIVPLGAGISPVIIWRSDARFAIAWGNGGDVMYATMSATGAVLQAGTGVASAAGTISEVAIAEGVPGMLISVAASGGLSSVFSADGASFADSTFVAGAYVTTDVVPTADSFFFVAQNSSLDSQGCFWGAVSSNCGFVGDQPSTRFPRLSWNGSRVAMLSQDNLLDHHFAYVQPDLTVDPRSIMAIEADQGQNTHQLVWDGFGYLVPAANTGVLETSRICP